MDSRNGNGCAKSKDHGQAEKSLILLGKLATTRHAPLGDRRELKKDDRNMAELEGSIIAA